ncbi:MAG: DUF1659 domain-containing protein [Paraclostridium sp.]
MAWLKASLKLVLETDEQLANGSYKMKSKTFSNLREGATEEKCVSVAQALAGLQQYSLFGVERIDVQGFQI